MQEENVTSSRKPRKKNLNTHGKDIFQGVVISLIVTGIIALLGFGWDLVNKSKSSVISKPTERTTQEAAKSTASFANPFDFLARLDAQRDQKLRMTLRSLRKSENVFEFWVFRYDFKLLSDRLSIYDAQDSMGKTIVWILLLLLSYVVLSGIVMGILPTTKAPPLVFFTVLGAICFIDIWLLHFALAVFLWYLFRLLIMGICIYMACGLILLLISSLFLGIAWLSDRFTDRYLSWPDQIAFGVISSHKVVIPILATISYLYLLYQVYLNNT